MTMTMMIYAVAAGDPLCSSYVVGCPNVGNAKSKHRSFTVGEPTARPRRRRHFYRSLRGNVSARLRAGMSCNSKLRGRSSAS